MLGKLSAQDCRWEDGKHQKVERNVIPGDETTWRRIQNKREETEDQSRQGMVVNSYNPSTRKPRQEDCKFKPTLGSLDLFKTNKQINK